MNIKVPRLECRRCGYTWTPRVPDVRQCPRCKSPKWEVARVEDSPDTPPPDTNQEIA